jgi:hypothetical protein
MIGSKRKRIKRDIQKQSDYVVKRVREQVAEGEPSPYTAYTCVEGLSPDSTVRKVGKAALKELGSDFILDCETSKLDRQVGVMGGTFVAFVATGQER